MITDSGEGGGGPAQWRSQGFFDAGAAVAKSKARPAGAFLKLKPAVCKICLDEVLL